MKTNQIADPRGIEYGHFTCQAVGETVIVTHHFSAEEKYQMVFQTWLDFDLWCTGRQQSRCEESATVMKIEHTPGPWRIGDAGQTVFGPPNGNPSPETVAANVRNKANARLIAAAPELLAALRSVLIQGAGDLSDSAFRRYVCDIIVTPTLAKVEGGAE